MTQNKSYVVTLSITLSVFDASDSIFERGFFRVRSFVGTVVSEDSIGTIFKIERSLSPHEHYFDVPAEVFVKTRSIKSVQEMK